MHRPDERKNGWKIVQEKEEREEEMEQRRKQLGEGCCMRKRMVDSKSKSKRKRKCKSKNT